VPHQGLAVVDEGGRPLASTSASDLKEFVRDPAFSLQQTVLDFVRAVQHRRTKATNPAITVRSTDTLATMIAKIAGVPQARIVTNHMSAA
jgi:hypothetical protein